MKCFLSLFIACLTFTNVFGQLPAVKFNESSSLNPKQKGKLALLGNVIWQEDFANAGNSFPYNNMITITKDTTSVGFVIGTAKECNQGIGFVVPENGKFAYTNDDTCKCNKSLDELITPSITFNGNTGAILQFQAYFNRVLAAESAEVFVESGANWVKLGSISSSPRWETYQFIIKGAGIQNPKIKFVYSDGGFWGSGLALDSLGVFELANQLDIRMDSLYIGQDAIHEFYKQIPINQSAKLKLNIKNKLTNISSQNASNVIVKTTLTGNQYFEDTTHFGNLAAATTTEKLGMQNVSVTGGIGSYFLSSYIHPNVADNDSLNDTLSVSFNVSDTVYSRVSNQRPLRSFWYGPGVQFAALYQVEITSADTATSISVFIDKDSETGDSLMDVLLYSEFLQNKIPVAFPELDKYIRIEKKHLGKWNTFKIPAAYLTPGKYFVGLRSRKGKIKIGASAQSVRKGISKASAGSAFVDIDYLPYVKLNLKGKACAILQANESIQTSGCGNKNGQILLAPSGGTAPYTFQWDKAAAYSTLSAINGIGSGKYSVTVTDANGCSLAKQFGVSDSSNVNVVVDSLRHEKCFGDSLGYIRLNISGGTSPYSVLWNDGNASATRDKLTTGNYFVEVTDAANPNCKVKQNIEVLGPYNELEASKELSHNLCFYDTSGSIRINATGGYGSYNYTWSSANLTGAFANNLSAGKYIVTITDNNGCSFIDSSKILSNDSIKVVGSVYDTSKLGSIILNITGATSSLKYNWAGPVNSGFRDPKTKDLVDLLDQGRYTVIVTDSFACQVRDTFNVAGSVSVVELIKPIDVSVFPNPSRGELTLNFNSEELANLYVFGQTGRLVRVVSGVKSNHVMQLPKGIYWLKLVLGQNRQHVLKVVVLE